MKPVFQAVLFLGLVTPSFSAVPAIDFDGKNKATKTFSDQLAETTQATKQETFSTTSQNIDNIPSFEMGIVTESGEKIKINPIIDPATKKGYYKFKPSQNIYWRGNCTSSNQGYYKVCETYKFSPNFAGHNHSSNIPPYTYSENGAPLASGGCVVSPYNTPVYWYLRTPEFSTRSDEGIQYVSGCSGTYSDIVDIMIDGLVLMPEPGNDVPTGVINYQLVGKTTAHPVNHFGTPQTIDLLRYIAQDYHQEFPNDPVLCINDMSLRWGGKFDVSGSWTGDHKFHRYGRQADVRIITIPPANRARFKEIGCGYGVQTVEEGKWDNPEDENKDLSYVPCEPVPSVVNNFNKSTGPHYHLNFAKSTDPVESPAEDPTHSCP